ncbi:MAG: acyl-CoA dehydrogenase family protein [Phenylobacterium sp.]|uniref:acyl-CoA dehydrogenase family protein n=1 Tax=Phenylobacterium sp. TaxID=1871053 RepID=UPI0025F55391|nr:acyl-CoA dehydrogenase family protein [Phenylobacterium sp.]MCG9915919.1 acyl-CoA dehydrogenase family protein [Phenylobacterium sp.]
MNLDLTPEQQAFRDEVRAFFVENTPQSFKARVRAGMRLEPAEFVTWQKLLHARGWGAPSWPKMYGGTGWDPTQLYIFETEASKADAPVQFHQGLELIGPIIFTFGSEAQKAKYLPAIITGDDWWCQGYSEPGAGSDLASLSTRAVRDGDHYVISGQKAWTSYAHVANRMFLLARTDPDARKQAGISLFLVDMDTPGITVRPVVTMDEIHHTNEVFLDAVRLPVTALLGEEGKGWGYGKVLLDRERGVTAATTTRLAQQLRGARAAAATARVGEGCLLDDPRIADRLAQLELEVMALEGMVMRTMAEAASGQDSGPRASMIKVRWSELLQEVTEFWTELQGYDAMHFGAVNNAPLPGPDPWAAKGMLYSRVTSIYGGSNEIQRNIIARRALGL